jgi:hypothetical protein
MYRSLVFTGRLAITMFIALALEEGVSLSILAAYFHGGQLTRVLEENC